MNSERGPDPNEGSLDPIEPEYWELGEAVQDAIVAAGYQAESVEGIAVDLHDLLQTTDRIRNDLAPQLAARPDRETMLALMEELKAHFHHLAWHCEAAQEFLQKADNAIRQ